mmetsp:Transcript_26167/g.104677  ORF Transcript_26167/g.104677 Transcript_26167/m.104677 type:complete len:125 (+) Transcript_26167:286-660(+)
MPLDPIFFVHARARALQLITLALIVDDISAEGEDVHVDHVMARIGMTVKTKGTHPTTRVAVLAGPCYRCGDSRRLQRRVIGSGVLCQQANDPGAQRSDDADDRSVRSETAVVATSGETLCVERG